MCYDISLSTLCVICLNVLYVSTCLIDPTCYMSLSDLLTFITYKPLLRNRLSPIFFSTYVEYIISMKLYIRFSRRCKTVANTLLT